MKNKSGFIKYLFLLTAIVMVTGMSSRLSAQEMGKDKGMMGGERPEDLVKMMQEPNKVLGNGSIQYLAIFTNLLHLQASQRPGQIDKGFIKVAFGEIKRGVEMAEQFQKEHVKTMDADMREKVKMMMGRMNKNLTGIKTQVDLLEKEINNGNKLDVISAQTGKMLEYLDDLDMMRSGMAGKPGMPGEKR
jgi:hypothetical protein